MKTSAAKRIRPPLKELLRRLKKTLAANCGSPAKIAASRRKLQTLAANCGKPPQFALRNSKNFQDLVLGILQIPEGISSPQMGNHRRNLQNAAENSIATPLIVEQLRKSPSGCEARE